ncbi:hypothetical protein M0812_17737 [Anaeramoeba flamelloides]|uniref:Reverse transcriptase domain-containing protein n=1 Tax=Anaeramoeba flamelloides TaxID=1746091 RepID=A0AAV7Z9I4_9EUKA|nr:hypothetical protein M0812_17737 [Anaeramoeba flamelloides]
MIINSIDVKTDWNIKKKYKIIDNNIYQKEFIKYFREQNFKLDTNSTVNIIYNENKGEDKIAPLIKNILKFKIDIFFPIENIKNTIKNLKNKSVKGFQKIENLKYINDEENNIHLNPIENKNYKNYLSTIQKIFNNWLNNPDNNNIEFIKKRSILFIHKKGNEGVALNYRPISINQSLPRLFLKMLYKLIEPCWECIHKSQFGFRKKYDTRIAVLNFLNTFNTIKSNNEKENNKTYIIMIDITKCFDSISFKIIRKTIKKFILNKIINFFLLKYYQGEGLGIFQGDPLSPILFALISHFLLLKIIPLTNHYQMFADDLILIVKGNRNQLN